MEAAVRCGAAAAGMALAMLALAVPAAAQSPVQTSRTPAIGDAARGEQLYHSRCGACHSLDANRVGPRHRGVFGRQVASVNDFQYSPALRTRSFVWDADMLDRWLTNPIALVPGTTMGFRVPAARDRADIIAWLRTQRAP